MASRRQNDRGKAEKQPEQQPQQHPPAGNSKRYVVTLPREYNVHGEVKKEFLKVGSMFVNESSHTCTVYLYVDLRRGDELVCFRIQENGGNRG